MAQFLSSCMLAIVARLVWGRETSFNKIPNDCVSLNTLQSNAHTHQALPNQSFAPRSYEAQKQADSGCMWINKKKVGRSFRVAEREKHNFLLYREGEKKKKSYKRLLTLANGAELARHSALKN